MDSHSLVSVAVSSVFKHFVTVARVVNLRSLRCILDILTLRVNVVGVKHVAAGCRLNDGRVVGQRANVERGAGAVGVLADVAAVSGGPGEIFVVLDFVPVGRQTLKVGWIVNCYLLFWSVSSSRSSASTESAESSTEPSE